MRSCSQGPPVLTIHDAVGMWGSWMDIMSLDDEGDGQELDLDAVTDGFDISIEGTIASAMGLTEDGSPSMP